MVKDYTWHSLWAKNTKNYYVVNNKSEVRLHRLIINSNNYKENKLQVDHINHDTLDNTRENLRMVSQTENQYNRKSTKGYTWNKIANKWVASIRINGKRKHIGLYTNEEEARNAYLEAKEKYHIIGGDVKC